MQIKHHHRMRLLTTCITQPLLMITSPDSSSWCPFLFSAFSSSSYPTLHIPYLQDGTPQLDPARPMCIKYPPHVLVFEIDNQLDSALFACR